MMTILTMIQSVPCVNSERTKEAISCSICAVFQKNIVRLGTSICVFCTNLPGLIRSFAGTGEGLHLHFDSAKTSCRSCSRIRHRTVPGDWFGATVDGTFFTTWSTPLIDWKLFKKWTARKLSESIRSYRRICARHSKPKLQLTWRVTRIKCCESILLKLPEVTEKRYFLLIWKKFTNRDLVQKEDEDDETETARPLSEREKRELFRQHLTWDIRSRRNWLVRYDTEEQDRKLHGLFTKSYVVQRAKQDLHRFHPGQECCHAVYV